MRISKFHGYRLGFAMVVLLVGCAASAAMQAQPAAKRFAFVSPQYIITAEVSGAHQFLLNFINISEYVMVVQASEFIYKGSSGQPYIGQVFDQQTKTTRGEIYRYSASVLINNGTFKGFNVWGAFHEQDQIQELSMRIGSKRYYLTGLDKVPFEKLQGMIENLDMRNTNGEASLKSVGLIEMGEVKTTDGTPEWDRDWQSQIRPDGINPPRTIETPSVTPTEDARKNSIYGTVKLSATITRDGIIQDLTVVKGLGHGLDERAIEAVKTSWVFLPATRNGEVVETKAQFEVPFPPPKSSPLPEPSKNIKGIGHG